jgi:hypothetical protein
MQYQLSANEGFEGRRDSQRRREGQKVKAGHQRMRLAGGVPSPVGYRRQRQHDSRGPERSAEPDRRIGQGMPQAEKGQTSVVAKETCEGEGTQAARKEYPRRRRNEFPEESRMPIDQKVDDCGANASGKDDIGPSPDYALAPNGPFLPLSVGRRLLSWSGLLPTWR